MPLGEVDYENGPCKSTRVGGLYKTKLIPARYVDIVNENGNRYGHLANETEEQCDRYGNWLAVKNAAMDWLMGHATELAETVGSVITNLIHVDPGVIIAGLSRRASNQDRALGGHLYTTANKYVKLKLIMD